MRRAHASDGQATIEWLAAMVALVALAALLVGRMAPVAEATTNAMRAAICAVSGASCPAAPAPQAVAGTDGPAIGDGEPIVILPFPGSVEVTAGGTGGVQVGDDPNAQATVTAEATAITARGCPMFDADGRELVTLSVATDLRVTGSGSGTAGGVGVGGSVFTGHRSTYAVTVSPDRVEDGDIPNPIDPTTLAPGEGIVLTEESYRGFNASGAYRQIRVELGYTEGQRVASGVTRIADGTVRVYVGDEEFVRNAIRLRLGPQNLGAAVGYTDERSSGTLHAIDLDISTAEGWNAYQGFISSGRLPAGDAPGVVDSSSSDVYRSLSQRQLEARIGSAKVSFLDREARYQALETTNADGSTRHEIIDRIDGVTVVHRVDRAPNGSVTSSGGSLLLRDVDPDLLDNLQRAHGAPTTDENGGQNVRLDFTDGQLLALQDQALEALAWINRPENNPNLDDDVTPGQIQELLRDGSHNGAINLYGTPFDAGTVERLATAETPGEILHALRMYGDGSPNAVVQLLWDTAANSTAYRIGHEPGADDLADHPAAGDLDVLGSSSGGGC